MNILIERARAADAAQLLEFLKQVGAETDNLTFGPEGMPFSVEAEAAFLAQLEHSQDDLMLVAKAEGRIIGNASLSRLPRRMCHRAEVSVAVAKEAWGQGTGRKLMEELIAFAQRSGLEILDLQVRSDNYRAIRLYEHLGFRKTGTHPAFFKIGGEYIPFDEMYLKVPGKDC